MLAQRAVLEERPQRRIVGNATRRFRPEGGPRTVPGQRRQHPMPRESIIEATSAEGHSVVGEDEAGPNPTNTGQRNLHSTAAEDET